MTLAEQIEQVGRAMTASEIGSLLKFGRTALYAMTKAGTIPSFRIGTSVRYDPHRIAESLRARAR
jgi:excisionase family DNA binding protein